jgi:DNA-3-methyladenine glycosylase I
MSWYCDFASADPLHRSYHDHEYGFPLTDERGLFERLCLEIFQAGLSWTLILRRRTGFQAALDCFAIDRIATYGEQDFARLLTDPRVIRNRRKLLAILENAIRVQRMRGEYGGFADWLAAHHPRREAEWTQLFRTTFRFTGPEIVREFLMSVGYLPGAHREDCPIYERIDRLAPPWRQSGALFYMEHERTA